MHIHHHHSDNGPKSIKNIKIAFFLNLAFTLIEIAGGFYTNSVAIISDALHDLGDSLTLGIAWYLANLSQKDRDNKYSYGYGRFSLLGALINSLILMLGSVWIIRESILRLNDPIQPETTGMLVLAVLGIIVNGLAAMQLRKGSSINERVVSLHLIEDVLGWVAVLIGAVIMKFYNIPYLDAMLSLGIAAFILFNVYKNLRSSLKIVMQGVPAHIQLSKIEGELQNIQGVEEVFDLHLWSMDGNYHILTVHLITEKESNTTNWQQIKDRAREVLKLRGIEHSTIEVGPKPGNPNSI